MGVVYDLPLKNKSQLQEMIHISYLEENLNEVTIINLCEKYKKKSIISIFKFRTESVKS